MTGSLLRPALAGLATLALVTACGGGNDPAPSPAPAPAGGTAAAPAAATSVHDGVFNETQAERGRDVFRSVCAECHETLEFRGDRFLLSWDGTSVGRFVDRLISTMPDGAPGSLPTQQYVDITAYILQLNGFPAGQAELPTDAAVLEGITIERGGEGRP